MKFALGIEYDGRFYHGWQKQKEVPSIQSSLEYALSTIANEPITVCCAGRTDAGVHAIGQVAHFETNVQRSADAWLFGINTKLPEDIAVHWVVPVMNDFHARFSAISRSYRYIIYNNHIRPALLKNNITYFSRPLDDKKMERAGQCLLGENDFTSFQTSQCQSHSPRRNMTYLRIIRHGRYLVTDIKANAFVYRMVRNIIGSLMEVGCGNKPEYWIRDLLMLRQRILAGPTAPAEGLYLTEVKYPSHFSLPRSSIELLFMI